MQQPSAQITISSKTLSSQIQISQIATIPLHSVSIQKIVSKPSENTQINQFQRIKNTSSVLIHFAITSTAPNNPQKKEPVF